MKSSHLEFCQNYYIDRKNTDSIKWDAPEGLPSADNAIALWVADMDFQTPEVVRNTLIRRIEHGVFGYSFPPKDYYEAVRVWHEKHFGYAPAKEWIRFSPGVVPALYWTVAALTEPKDSVLILTPVYFPFQNAVKGNGRTLITSDLIPDEKGYYQMDFADIESKIKAHKVKLLIHCSPHNPVGRVWTAEELEKLFSLCEQHHVLIVSDEIHQDIMIGRSRFLSAAMVGAGKYYNRLIILNSASKTFNLAGLGLAHTIIPDPDLRRRYDTVTEPFAHSAPNILGMLATQTAYRQGEKWLHDLLSIIESNYHYLQATLSAALPKLVISPLEGTYLAWIDMRGYLPPEELENFFTDRCHLAVHYGKSFGESGNGYIRVNLATHPDLITEACRRIIETLQ